MTILILALGLIVLLAGGDMLVRGAVAAARQLGVSPLLVGLTLVGFGTSTPELVTSLQAAALGSPGIAVGNVVGSNIANILLILGIAALITPLACTRAALLRDGSVLALSALACAGATLQGTIGGLSGLLFVIALIGYVVFTYVRERRVPDASAGMHAEEGSLAEPGPRRLWLALLLAVSGIALTILGARLLVDSAIALASAAGVSETVLGLTIVAVGTSLPELVTSVVAALRRQADVAFGNIVGSNIYNVLGILGITALVQPIAVPPEILRLDLWVMLLVTGVFLLFAWTGLRLTRLEAGIFLAGYAGYLAVLLT